MMRHDTTANTESSSAGIHCLLLIVLCGVLYFPYLASTAFFDKGEPREAMAVQDIMTRGEWLVPLKRATDIPSKPPLFHWSAALTATIAGKLNEATIRFPSALYATLAVLAVYFLGRSMFGGETALLGAAILATTLVYANQALSARVDMTLCFFVTLSLALFYALYRGFLQNSLWYYVFYALVGVSTLAKGPLGVLLTVLVCAVFVLMKRRWDLVGKFCMHPGVLLMIVLAAGWYVIAVSRGGDGFFSRQIIQENLARFAGGSGHSHPLYYYLPYLFSQGLPWAIFLPFLCFDVFKHKWFTDDAKVFLALWFAAMFAFFSLSVGKRAVYLLPVYPALSLLLAVWFRDHISGVALTKWLYRLIALNAALIGVVLLIITLGALWNHDPAWFFTPIGKMLRAKDRANLFVIRDALADFGAWFTVVAVLSSALWFALGQALWRENMLAAARRLVLIQILLGFVTRAIVMPAIADAKSYRPFMEAVNQRVSATDKLYLYGDFNSDPLVFYRGAPIAFLQAQMAELAQRAGSGKSYIIMPVETWRQVQAFKPKLGSSLLLSSGTGPEGDAPLVLVQGGET
jgi:4-amino-4-deoxy-L-arabinose transferase-like glycosyltransferase